MSDFVEDDSKKVGIGHILRIINNKPADSNSINEKQITVQTLYENRDITLALERVELICKEVDLIKHGKHHALYVSKVAGEIIKKSGATQRDVQLAEIAGYIHDLGYRLDIENHSFVSAGMAYEKLHQLNMPQQDIDKVCLGIAYHNSLKPINIIGAALAIAEYSDYIKERAPIKYSDDLLSQLMSRCVSSELVVDDVYKIIRLKIEFDFADLTKQNYLDASKDRHLCCREAAGFLGFEYQVILNDEMVI